MKKITLLQMKLLNFKGLRAKEINFSNVTDIFGNNGTGKTTIMDAFLWLLFGKDSTDRKDFEIKTLDSENKPYHKLSHEVSALIDVDGDQVTIRRTFKENWPTKKGTATETFTGHKTEFFWNDVPLNETEFKRKIATILDETLFKLITNTGYFNGLKWQERRNILEPLAGTITHEMVAECISGVDCTTLIKELNNGKTLSDYKKQIAAKKKLIRDEKDLLPSRIDEAKRSLPEYVDYSALAEKLENAKGAVETIDAQIADKNLVLWEEQQKKSELQQAVHKLSSELRDIEFAERSKVQDRKRLRDQDLNTLRQALEISQTDLRRVSLELSNEASKKANIESLQADLRNKWNDVNNEQLQFKDGAFDCPSCKRALDPTNAESKKEELTKNFNQDKTRRLEEIVQKGQQYGNTLKTVEANITNYTAAENNLTASISHIQTEMKMKSEQNEKLSANDDQEYTIAIDANENYRKIQGQIEELQQKINVPIPPVDTAELQNQKKALAEVIETYTKQISTKEQREKIESRITQLQDQETAQAQEIATLEGIEFTILQFEKAKMDLLESKINSLFSVAKFKMFQTNINGGEEPCCDTLINGVPYSDANTASKIQAGVDIINTLCTFHNISAPIFIDNRESVFLIPDSESQIVNLIASEPDLQLRVVNAAA